MIGGVCGSSPTYECSQQQGPMAAAHANNIFSSKQEQLSHQNKTSISNEQGAAGNTPTPSGQIDHFGGAGSAWRSSVYSRGPVNYPNNGWEKGNIEFNQFSKTGTYIKNTDLPYAVAPISTGAVKDNSPVQGTVSDFLSNYAAYGAGKKKSIKKKTVKKKKSVKKKSVKKKSLTKKKK
tara:strand:- start:2604 stop:3137 length:534 start_codon:yes stop_codon:yes gene_type:complete